IFRMPSVPEEVICTFTNTRASATITLQKSWVDAAGGDTADLIITSTDTGTAGSGLSTATGAPGTQNDTDNAVEVPLFAGSTVVLVENLPAGSDTNTGTYISEITCDAPSGFTPNPGGRGGTLVVPAVPEAVVCTITNTR